MKKTNIWKLLVLTVLVISLCLPFAGCKETPAEEPGQTTTVPTTDPVPEQTDPEPSETQPQETDPEPVILQAGTMSKHMKGKNGDAGIYFMMEPNEIPADSSWETEFRPTSKNAVQLFRNGEVYDIGTTAAGMIIKYSDTEYYLKLEQWLLKDYFPIRDGDILKIEGIFRNAAIDVMFQIETSYIQVSEGLVFFSTEYPEGSGVNVKYVGNPTSHPNGKTSDGIYFKLEKNSVPYDDWTIEYSPATESAVQLIRDGKTYNIGNKAAGTIVKYSDTEYYLKLEQWIIKDFYPIRDGDVIVLNGKFVNSGVSTVFSISKTYISINEGLLTFSTEYPTESGVEAQVIPTMLEHPNGFTGTGLYFKAAEANTLPYDGWLVEYFPREAGCIKLIRGDETYDIANVDAGTIVKYSDTEYYFKLEQWMYRNYYPFVDGDILVVEGKFVNAGLAGLMEIGKTYITFSGGMAYFSTEYPTGPVGPTRIQGGTMSSHPDGWKSDANGGLYFKLDANDAPFATDWSLRYVPTTTGAIKLIRNGVTTDVANTGAEMLVKYGEDSYYMEFWPISMKPIVEGDTLVIEGSFVNAANNVVLVIDKTYVTIENGQPVFTTEASSVIEAGHMQPHANGWNTSNNEGLYFKLNANEVPYDGWNTEYEPVSAASIKLIRGEETYNIGIPGRGTVVKYSDTEYYLKLVAWTIGEYAPIVPGDVLIVEGEFKNADNGVTFNISRTVITVGENYELTFTDEENVDGTIQAGVMSSHPNGWNTQNNKGMYFTLASNEVPYSDQWDVFYYPTTAENIKLIRDGETVNIAQTDREFIVKFEDTGYYLKLEKWTIGDYFPLVSGDVLMVEGNFTNQVSGVTFNISKTYITIGDNYSLSFSETAPEQKPEGDGSVAVNGFKPHSTNGFNTGSMDGLYCVADANTAPFDGWTIEYTPVEASGYRLVRGDETFDIGIPGRGTLVKFSENEYYLKFGWCVGDYANTVTVGDQLIVEGKWRQNTGGDAVLDIARTVITIGEGYTLTFETEFTEPEDPDVTDPENDGALQPHFEKGLQLSGVETLIYAVMEPNSGVHNGWETEYTPVEAAGLRLVREGETYEIGNPGQGTLVKYSETEYCLKLAPWTVTGGHLPLRAGDQVIVAGAYTGREGTACEGSTITIAQTIITYNADGTVTFDSAETEPENHGPMAAHSVNGWTATGGLYFTMAANDMPYNDWNIRYTPTAESNVKLIRGGQTYDVAHTQRETIVKFSETEYYYEFWTLDTYKPIVAGDVLIVEGDFVNTASGATLQIAKTTITIHSDGTATFQSEVAEPEDPEVTEPEATEPEATQPDITGLVMKAWDEKAWNTGSNGGFWFTMDANDIPADETWVLEYTPVSADVLKLVRNGETVNIAIPGRGTFIKANDAEYYLKLEWNIGDYANAITVGDQIIVEGDFTNATNGVTFTVKKTTVTIGENYALTFDSEDSEPEDDAIQVGNMTENSGGITDGIIYFSLPDNDLPSSLTKSDFRPENAGVIKLIRDGVTYEIADPQVKTVVKQTASKYRLLRSALTMTLQSGDILVVEGKFTGGNTDQEAVYTISIGKTYIFIGDGVVTFSTELPAEE